MLNILPPESMSFFQISQLFSALHIAWWILRQVGYLIQLICFINHGSTANLKETIHMNLWLHIILKRNTPYFNVIRLLDNN